MAPGHLYAGNRVRTAGPIKLRSDMAWAEKLTPNQKRLTWLFAGHKLRQYGYDRQLTSALVKDADDAQFSGPASKAA